MKNPLGNMMNNWIERGATFVEIKVRLIELIIIFMFIFGVGAGWYFNESLTVQECTFAFNDYVYKFNPGTTNVTEMFDEIFADQYSDHINLNTSLFNSSG